MFGKTGKEKPRMVQFNDMFVEIVGVDSVDRQFYQWIRTIVVSVKYASS